MKKIISCLLVLAMMATMIPAVALGAFALTAIPEDSTTVTVDDAEFVVIRSKADLMAQIDENNEITKNLILANDIDMGGETFKGQICQLHDVIIDGNGYAIHNFALSGADNVSLFGVWNGTGTAIRNLSFGKPDAPIQVTSTATADGKRIGVILSYTNSKTVFENINVYGNVENTTGKKVHAGLFAGEVNGSHAWRNCNAYGSVKNTGNNAAGGFIGYIGNYDTTTLTFESCSNHASVSGAVKAAGFVGQCTANKVMRFINCTNYGVITCTGTSSGGFIGECYFSGGPAIDYDFTDCVNYGTVNGVNKTAGIIAFFNSGTNGAGYDLKLKGCINYGSINGSGGDSGGIIGTIQSGDNITAINCANFGTISGSGTNKAGFCGSIAMGGTKTQAVTLKVSYFLNMGAVISGSRAAGVSGWLGAAAGAGYQFDHCVNLGSLSGKNDSGGIAAMAAGTMTVSNCISAGNLVTTSGSFGAIIGVAGSATGENNRYMKFGDPKTDLCSTELATWDDVLAALNADYAAVFGTFMLNDSSDGVVFAAPKLAGVQESKIENGEFNIRLVATINSARYSSVGFKITLNDSTEVNQLSCKTIFTKLRANADGNMISYTASELGGAYIFALNVDGLSATESYTLHVTPYAIDLDGETVYDGTGYTITYANGAYCGATPAEN